MNTRLVLLVVGLLVGAILGWATAPKVDVVKVGPLNLQVTGENNGSGGSITATGNDGQINVQVGNPSPLDDRNTRTLIFAVVGALVGLGAGTVMNQRKKT